jgi:DNA invertase Pin-like site-specific DNA recombinase
VSTIGYARTSTSDQLAGLAAQGRDLLAAGADRVISEHISAVGDRPRLDACLASLRAGDVLMVTKPDRLARSTTHLLSIVEDLNKRGVGLILLSMGGEKMDTRNPTSKLILTVMAGIATWEREIMMERQREGIIKAKSDGKYRGRKPSIDRERLVALVDDIGPEKAGREMGIGRTSVYRLLGQKKVASPAVL